MNCWTSIFPCLNCLKASYLWQCCYTFQHFFIRCKLCQCNVVWLEWKVNVPKWMHAFLFQHISSQLRLVPHLSISPIHPDQFFLPSFLNCSFLFCSCCMTVQSTVSNNSFFQLVSKPFKNCFLGKMYYCLIKFSLTGTVFLQLKAWF